MGWWKEKKFRGKHEFRGKTQVPSLLATHPQMKRNEKKRQAELSKPQAENSKRKKRKIKPKRR